MVWLGGHRLVGRLFKNCAKEVWAEVYGSISRNRENMKISLCFTKEKHNDWVGKMTYSVAVGQPLFSATLSLSIGLKNTVAMSAGMEVMYESRNVNFHSPTLQPLLQAHLLLPAVYSEMTAFYGCPLKLSFCCPNSMVGCAGLPIFLYKL